MRIAPVADVKARLSAYLEQCEAEGPIVITRNGRAVAVLLAPYDVDDLERLVLSRSPRLQALLNKSSKSIKEGKGLSRDAFWKAVRQRAHKQKQREVRERGGRQRRTP
jgi:prevent-host-death family protein